MDLLLLTTPPQHSAHNPKAERNPKRLKAWLDQLPVTNVADTVRNLQMSLQAINEVPIAPGDRFKLLEQYVVFFDETVTYYDDMRVRSLSIRSAERRALLQDVLWLYLSLANGYKIIVKEYFDNNASPARDTIYINSIFRALECLSQAILYARRVGEDIPALTFLEFKQLFLLSEQHAVHNTPVKITNHQANTCALLLKHISLFSIGDASATNEELGALFAALEPFATHCNLLPGDLKSQRSGRYWLDLLEDGGPTACEQLSQPNVSPFLRIFDITSALAHIENSLKAGSTADAAILENERRLLQSFIASARSGSRTHAVTAWPRKGLCALGHDSANFYLQHPDRAMQPADVEVFGGIEVRSIGDTSAPVSSLIDCEIMTTSHADELILSLAASVDPAINFDDPAALVVVREGKPHARAAIIKYIEPFVNGHTRVHIKILPSDSA